MTARKEESDLRELFKLLKNQGKLEQADQKRKLAEQKRVEKETAIATAIQKTEDLYNVHVVQPRGSHVVGGPLAGTNISFAPKFLDNGYEFRQVQGTDGRTHYFGANFRPDVMGVTWPDGETIILPGLFKQALKENDPGILAALLYHEAVHFNELVTRRWDTLQAGEVRAYDAELGQAAAFSLSQLQRQKATDERDANQALLDSGDPKKIFQAYPVPEQEAWAKGQFDIHAAEQQKLKAEMDQFKADLLERRRAQESVIDPRNSVRDLARRFCGAPGSVQEREFSAAMSSLVAFCRQNSCSMSGVTSCTDRLQTRMFDAAKKGQLYEGLWKNMIAREARGPQAAPPMAAVPPSDGPKAAQISDPTVPTDAQDLAKKVCRGYQVNQDELDSLLERLGSYMRRSLPLSRGLEYTCDGMLYNQLCDAAHDGRALSARAFIGKFHEWQDRHRPQAADPPPQNSSPSWNPGPDRPDHRTHSTPPPSSNLDLDHAKETVEKDKKKAEECHWTDPRNDCWNKH
jgi:hypothetical protein